MTDAGKLRRWCGKEELLEPRGGVDTAIEHANDAVCLHTGEELTLTTYGKRRRGIMGLDSAPVMLKTKQV